MKQTYINWKTVTEADFVSLFIKTWFAYISTLREMFPEAYNRRGDKKYLNAYKDFYQHEGSKRLIVDENIMASIEKLYREGRKIIMTQYPEYYFWDFYRVNDDFNSVYKDISPDKTEGFIVGLNLYRNRGTSHSFTITGFVKFWGIVRGIKYDDNIRLKLSISDILKSSEVIVKENPKITEQDYLSWLVDTVQDQFLSQLANHFDVQKSKEKRSKSVSAKYNDALASSGAVIRSVFVLNAKDRTFFTTEEMNRPRNAYEIFQQRPFNYFEYHMSFPLIPERELTSSEERWFHSLSEQLKRFSIIWFLDFVYRLRNALFHEIIDPLDAEWQIVFKNAYLILKEIVDINIAELEKTEQNAE